MNFLLNIFPRCARSPYPWGDLGANWDDPAAGSPSETPHMNALAADGMRFTDGHAGASVCGPSRSAIMTGRLGIRNGITHNSGYKWLAGLPRSELTLGEMMKRGGFDTLMLGKCVPRSAARPRTRARHCWRHHCLPPPAGHGHCQRCCRLCARLCARR